MPEIKLLTPCKVERSTPILHVHVHRCVCAEINTRHCPEHGQGDERVVTQMGSTSKSYLPGPDA